MTCVVKTHLHDFTQRIQVSSLLVVYVIYKVSLNKWTVSLFIVVPVSSFIKMYLYCNGWIWSMKWNPRFQHCHWTLFHPSSSYSLPSKHKSLRYMSILSPCLLLCLPQWQPSKWVPMKSHIPRGKVHSIARPFISVLWKY